MQYIWAVNRDRKKSFRFYLQIVNLNFGNRYELFQNGMNHSAVEKHILLDWFLDCQDLSLTKSVSSRALMIYMCTIDDHMRHDPDRVTTGLPASSSVAAIKNSKLFIVR